jgi:hypothetical protein
MAGLDVVEGDFRTAAMPGAADDVVKVFVAHFEGRWRARMAAFAECVRSIMV